MEDFKELVVDSLDKYFNILKYKGYVNEFLTKSLVAFLGIVYVLDTFLYYIKEKDVKYIYNALLCLSGNCLIDFPKHFYTLETFSLTITPSPIEIPLPIPEQEKILVYNKIGHVYNCRNWVALHLLGVTVEGNTAINAGKYKAVYKLPTSTSYVYKWEGLDLGVNEVELEWEILKKLDTLTFNISLTTINIGDTITFSGSTENGSIVRFYIGSREITSPYKPEFSFHIGIVPLGGDLDNYLPAEPRTISIIVNLKPNKIEWELLPSSSVNIGDLITFSARAINGNVEFHKNSASGPIIVSPYRVLESDAGNLKIYAVNTNVSSQYSTASTIATSITVLEALYEYCFIPFDILEILVSKYNYDFNKVTREDIKALHIVLNTLLSPVSLNTQEEVTILVYPKTGSMKAYEAGTLNEYNVEGYNQEAPIHTKIYFIGTGTSIDLYKE